MATSPRIIGSALPHHLKGQAISVTRRFIEVLTSPMSGGDTQIGNVLQPLYSSSDSTILLAQRAKRDLELANGDLVDLRLEGSEYVVCNTLPRSNFLMRSYEGTTKTVAANISLLLIVASADSLFNHNFIDRLLCAATVSGIDVAIVCNKVDLYGDVPYSDVSYGDVSYGDVSYGDVTEHEGLQIAPDRLKQQPFWHYLEYYSKIGIPIIYTSTKQADGLTSLWRKLVSSTPESSITEAEGNEGDTLEIATGDRSGLPPFTPRKLTLLVGHSGVGKSSLLKALIPEAIAKIGEVAKNGLGRQTTTQARLFLLPLPSQTSANRSILLGDFPGIQNFGLAHLSTADVIRGFTDLRALASNCRYTNCSHTAEQGCALASATSDSQLPSWRMACYRQILAEVKRSQKY